MKHTEQAPAPDHPEQLARDIRAAVQELFSGGAVRDVSYKADGSPVTAMDRRLESALVPLLRRATPACPVLSEEMTPGEQQAVLDAGRPFWCLDPLDGTTNFIHGLPFFAVSLALIDRFGAAWSLTLDPNRDECFTARRGAGAMLNGRVLEARGAGDFACNGLDDCVGVVDFKRLDRSLARPLAQSSPFASMRNLGSVALEWCWLAAGRFEVYLHGGQKLWDYAPGQLIAQEAGAVARALDGDELFCWDTGPRAALGAASPELWSQMRDWLSSPPAVNC
ncbi:MAG: inositol monophosphatase family protein [Gammaproteobacteria bacterium]